MSPATRYRAFPPIDLPGRRIWQHREPRQSGYSSLRLAEGSDAVSPLAQPAASITPDQLFFKRPVPHYADYRSPISGLYLCGSGTHPGGGVTGAPGHNAAKVIAADLRRRR